MILPKYKSAPLRLWSEAKFLRKQFYDEFLNPAGIHVAACCTSSFAPFAGLGNDVYILASEPYGASIATHSEFSLQCLQATDSANVGRDLCAYQRNYFGSLVLDKFAHPDHIVNGFPRTDLHFSFATSYCNAKWHQLASEKKQLPLYLVDMPSVYPHYKKRAIDYVVTQMLDGIEWLEKNTGRKYNDELFIEAMHNECESFKLWAEIVSFNQVIPAPLDEKTMFSLYVLNTLAPHRREVVEFMRKLKDEIGERVEKGIAAVPYESVRFLSEAIPPWPFLKIWRYMEEEFGAVCVGSTYTFALSGCWKLDDKGDFVPVKTPRERGLNINTREDALRALIEYRLHWCMDSMYVAGLSKYEATRSIARQWKVNAAVIHLNRGCAPQGLTGMQVKLALQKENIPVFTYEGSSADARDFNYSDTLNSFEAFTEELGLARIKK